MRIPGIAVLAVSTLLASGAAQAQVATGYVISDLNMRDGPGARYERLTVIPAGVSVDVYDCTGGWCTVGYGGWQGHVSGRYLELADEPGGYAEQGSSDVYYKGAGGQAHYGGQPAYAPQASYGGHVSGGYAAVVSPRGHARRQCAYKTHRYRTYRAASRCVCPHTGRLVEAGEIYGGYAPAYAGGGRYGHHHGYRAQGYRTGSSYSAGVHAYRGRGAVRADYRHGRHDYRDRGHRRHAHHGGRHHYEQPRRHGGRDYRAERRRHQYRY